MYMILTVLVNSAGGFEPPIVDPPLDDEPDEAVVVGSGVLLALTRAL